MEIKELFDKHEGEYLKTDRIENMSCRSPDLHAFNLLHSLLPKDGDIVSAGEHDVIFLNYEGEELEGILTEDHVIELQRCGVFYDAEFECLKMFV